MTTELFDRAPSAGARLAKPFDWQARKIGGVYVPDLEKIPLADRAAREGQIRRIAGDCGCRLAAAIAAIATAAYGAALGFSLLSVSASPLWIVSPLRPALRLRWRNGHTLRPASGNPHLRATRSNAW